MMPEPTGELSKTWALPLTVLYLMLLGFATACLVIGHIVLLRICVAKDGAGDCVSYAYVDSGRVIASAGLLVVLFGLGFALFCVTVRNAQRIRLEAVEQLEAIRYQLQQADAALLENSGTEVVSLKSIAEISDGSVEPPKVRSVSFEGYGFPPKSLPQSMADCDAVIIRGSTTGPQPSRSPRRFEIQSTTSKHSMRTARAAFPSWWRTWDLSAMMWLRRLSGAILSIR